MKRIVLSICAGAALAAQAGTVVISSVGGKRFTTASGISLPSGTSVRIGTFNLPAETRDQTLRSTFDYAQLKAWFKPLAEGVIGGGTTSQAAGAGSVLRNNNFPAAGEVFGSISEISTSYVSPGTPLYAWVFNEAAPDDCTQWGLFTASTWVAPQALGTQTLSTAGSVEALQGSVTGTQLRLGSVPVTFGNWSWKTYSLTASSALTARGADPDQDGHANVAEYAWKLNPAARDGEQTVLAPTASGATFTFKSPRATPDVAVSAECSTDLTHWFPAPSTVVSSDAEFDTRVCTAEPGQSCFWRVRFDTVTAP